VRVHEELLAGGAQLSYAALTAFCRRHGIGYQPPVAAGQYDFAPGEELQHDTSPHEIELAGKKRKVQTASAVLCYSRMLFSNAIRRSSVSMARCFSPTRCAIWAGPQPA
jgi:hypothetical protein